jgi:sulfoxide reductase heme-binding subunit YedZ
LLLGSATLSGAAWVAGDPAGARDRLSLLTAWLCFALLAAALALGPRESLRTGRPVLNSQLRRDVGIWGGLAGLAHLFAATGEVMRPEYYATFITGTAATPLATWLSPVSTLSIVGGYLIGLLLLMLLALSNNWSLRRLGPARWKRLQRGSILAFALTAAHGVVFQVIEGRTGGWLAALVVVTAALLALRRRARRSLAATAG